MQSRMRLSLHLLLVVVCLALAECWWSGSDEHPAMFVRGRKATLSPHTFTFHEQSVVGVQVEIPYNVSITLAVGAQVVYMHQVGLVTSQTEIWILIQNFLLREARLVVSLNGVLLLAGFAIHSGYDPRARREGGGICLHQIPACAGRNIRDHDSRVGRTPSFCRWCLG